MAMNNPTYLGGTIQTGPILISSTTSTSNPPLSFNDSGVFLAAGATVANYAQAILQNLSNAAAASTDYVVGNDLQTATTFYGDFGMNSSGFTGTGPLNAPNNVYVTATSGDLILATTTGNAVRILANGSAADAITVTSNNIVRINSKTLVLGGNFSTTGAFSTVLAQQVSGTYTLPLLASTTLAVQPTVTVFAASGTFTPQTTSTWIMYLLVGGGGQGGYGGSYAKATGGSGGGGGGAGGVNFGVLQASSFGATSTVTVGAGGTGAGNSGTPAGAKGGITSITLAAGARYAGGGGGGGGGTVSATSGGGGGASNYNAQASSGTTTGGLGTTFGSTGGTGASGGTTGIPGALIGGTGGGGTSATGGAFTGGSTGTVPNGGGSGGGFAVAGAAAAGGAAGTSIIDGAASSPAGGAATGARGTDGSQNTYVTLGQGFTSTGGGGGGSAAAATGGAGGNGGLGSGGGGGGSGDSGGSFLGGTGGNGGNGYVIFLEG